MFGPNCPIGNRTQRDEATGHYLIPNTNLSFLLCYKAADLPEGSVSEHLFHHRPYLEILEKHPSKDCKNIYIEVYEDGVYLGRIHAQSVLVNSAESMNLGKKPTNGFAEKCKHWIMRQYSRHWFVVGNLLLTGNYGPCFPSKSIRETFIITEAIVKQAAKVAEKDLGHGFTFIFYKDFSAEESAQSEALADRNYYCSESEPSMVMEIDPEWDSFEDYLAAMSSKYRVRAKRAYKKGKDLERLDMDAETLARHKERIHELYQGVAHGADFNLVHLHPDYFLELKRQLPEKFKLVGYFLEGKLIGYFTTIKDGRETHAHYLGLENQYNRSHQLYLNILYDIVKEGIANQSALIDFARTAPEIKSSVGAVPRSTYLYLRHCSNAWNRLLPYALERLQPEEQEIVYRSPFKNKPQHSPKPEKASSEKPQSDPVAKH